MPGCSLQGLYCKDLDWNNMDSCDYHHWDTAHRKNLHSPAEWLHRYKKSMVGKCVDTETDLPCNIHQNHNQLHCHMKLT